jgi:hypothetical protein
MTTPGAPLDKALLVCGVLLLLSSLRWYFFVLPSVTRIAPRLKDPFLLRLGSRLVLVLGFALLAFGNLYLGIFSLVTGLVLGAFVRRRVLRIMQRPIGAIRGD